MRQFVFLLIIILCLALTQTSAYKQQVSQLTKSQLRMVQHAKYHPNNILDATSRNVHMNSVEDLVSRMSSVQLYANIMRESMKLSSEPSDERILTPCQEAVIHFFQNLTTCSEINNLFQDFENLNLTEMNERTQNYCTSNCVTNLESSIQNMFQLCNRNTDNQIQQILASGDFLRNISTLIKTPCIQDNQTYCFPKFFDGIRQLNQNSNGFPNASVLPHVCNRCFAKVIVVLISNDPRSAQDFEYFPLLCLRRVNGEFCLPDVKRFIDFADQAKNYCPNSTTNTLENGGNSSNGSNSDCDCDPFSNPNCGNLTRIYINEFCGRSRCVRRFFRRAWRIDCRRGDQSACDQPQMLRLFTNDCKRHNGKLCIIHALDDVPAAAAHVEGCPCVANPLSSECQQQSERQQRNCVCEGFQGPFSRWGCCQEWFYRLVSSSSGDDDGDDGPPSQDQLNQGCNNGNSDFPLTINTEQCRNEWRVRLGIPFPNILSSYITGASKSQAIYFIEKVIATQKMKMMQKLGQSKSSTPVTDSCSSKTTNKEKFECSVSSDIADLTGNDADDVSTTATVNNEGVVQANIVLEVSDQDEADTVDQTIDGAIQDETLTFSSVAKNTPASALSNPLDGTSSINYGGVTVTPEENPDQPGGAMSTRNAGIVSVLLTVIGGLAFFI